MTASLGRRSPFAAWRVEPTLNGVTLTHLTCGQTVAAVLPQPVTLEALANAAAGHDCPGPTRG